MDKKGTKKKKKVAAKEVVSDDPYFNYKSIETSTYEGVDPKFEYLDLSNKNLHIGGMSGVLADMREDTVIKHINLSYNVNIDETDRPSSVVNFITMLKSNILVNDTLTAMDLAGNHLFLNSEHPINNHKSNYVIDFANLLMESKITHIDLSDNDICGGQNRMLKGLRYLCKNYVGPHAKALKLRQSNLHSLCFAAVSDALGISSSLTYLDLSDNFGGLNPVGDKSNEGMLALSNQLIKTLNIRYLKLARNSLDDEDVIILSQAIMSIPSLQLLDLAGNNIHGVGAEALARAIKSHSTLTGTMGLKDLDLSANPLGSHGVLYLDDALRTSTTLNFVKFSYCGFDTDTMKKLEDILKENPNIIYLDVEGNPCSELQYMLTTAQIEANRVLYLVTRDASAVNARELSLVVYNAVAQKLKYLPSHVLRNLHNNPSFTEYDSYMQVSLYLCEPPSRNSLIKRTIAENTMKWGALIPEGVNMSPEGKHMSPEGKHTSPEGKRMSPEGKGGDGSPQHTLEYRLKLSRQVEKKLMASRKIYYKVCHWYGEVKEQRRIKAAILEAKLKAESSLVTDS
jgi:Ran GTPase-activating protein (RanGAP) involved in mRNA processing and transport